MVLQESVDPCLRKRWSIPGLKFHHSKKMNVYFPEYFLMNHTLHTGSLNWDLGENIRNSTASRHPEKIFHLKRDRVSGTDFGNRTKSIWPYVNVCSNERLIESISLGSNEVIFLIIWRRLWEHEFKSEQRTIKRQKANSQIKKLAKELNTHFTKDTQMSNSTWKDA